MANLLNPSGYLQIDVLYYLLILVCGPSLLVFLLWFEPKRYSLMQLYRTSGVEIMGVVTHQKLVIYRGTFGQNRGNTRHIRYAYKPPGTTDCIFFKDFIEVKLQHYHARTFPVVVLPGQDFSGIPKFLVKPERSSMWKLCGIVVSLAFTGFAWYVFSLIWSYVVLNHCVEIGYRTEICVVKMTDMTCSAFTILLLGTIFAAGWNKHLKSFVPGRIWAVFRTTTTVVQHENNVQEIIPFAEVVSVLGSSRASYETFAAEAEAVVVDAETEGTASSDNQPKAVAIV